VVFLSLISLPTLASYDVNIPPPASPIAAQIYGLHMYILWVCAIIFVVVFSLMFYSIFKFRKSKGAKADVNFHESTLIEIIWTIIPFIILIAMAVPATKTVLDMKDTSTPDITVRILVFTPIWRRHGARSGSQGRGPRKSRAPIICSKSIIRWWYRSASVCVY